MFYGSTHASYLSSSVSRLSFLFSPIDHLRLNPSKFSPPPFLCITRPRVSLHYPSTSSILSMTVIIPRSWPSWVCRVSAHGGSDVNPTLASTSTTILFRVCHAPDARGGCNVYPVLAFLFITHFPSRPSSMFRSLFSTCRVCNSSSSRRQFLDVNGPLSLFSSLSMSMSNAYGFTIVANSSPETRGAFGTLLPSPSPLFVLFLGFVFSGTTWIPFSITVYCHLSVCLFSRYPLSFQPNLLLRSQPRFVLPAFQLRLLPSRLRSDFFCRSSYCYSLPMARLLLRFLSSVDLVDFSSFRQLSSLYRPLSLPARFLPAMQSSIMTAFPFLGGIFFGSPQSLLSRHLFVYVSRFMLFCLAFGLDFYGVCLR